MRNKGKLFLIIGIFALAGAVGITVYNVIDDMRASESANSRLALVMDYVFDEDREIIDDPLIRRMPTEIIDGVEYVGMISIPSVDINLPVINICNDEMLKLAPCRYNGSVFTDDLVIAGHNYSSHFGQLGNLKYGDNVIFVGVDGKVYNYEVAELDILDSHEVDNMITADDWDLTLFTCTLARVTRVTVRCIRTD